MKTLKFKTNIKCNGCINAVTPFLDKSNNISDWSVDLESPDRILTIKTEEGDADEVKELLNEAGYKAEELGNT
ncbi:MAG: copper chaperone [Anaerophaga sp.]|uniref:heavy-metal-associated domain-containing protein n=1 Tax=Anaerophaga thermohalophila TaxID=177400 RepID=UPI000237D1FA|nr:heavy-metal-associated domain-containing protein [Anaerophaga thermohalophila]MDK2842294.1 copper chaperone [Anaerophaga sp.]